MASAHSRSVCRSLAQDVEDIAVADYEPGLSESFASLRVWTSTSPSQKPTNGGTLKSILLIRHSDNVD